MNLDRLIYLDNNATSRTAPAVVEAMQPYWSDAFYNPTSLAAEINGIRRPLSLAVDQLAELLNANSDEFTLTSGATEANNWVLQSVVAERLRTTGKCHILLSAIEHPSIIETADELCIRDPRIIVEQIPVSRQGVVRLDALRQMLRSDTALVSVMLANNETGVIQPVHEASQIAKEKASQCLFHSDATQAVGKLVVDLQSMEHVDLLSLSAHKFRGPKGIGALFIRRGTRLESWMHGGSQQGGRRAGTENPALAAGLAKAIELLGSKQHIENQADLVEKFRDRLEVELMVCHPEIQALGSGTARLANTSLMVFPDNEGEMLVHHLLDHGIVASTGAACANGSDRPSHVLISMGVDYAIARNALRLSLSPDTTGMHVDKCIRSLCSILVDA
jgi:cysteine desulfurase